MSLKYVLINSILAYISASLLATIIHETGHFITALSFGLDSTLYHNNVQSSETAIFLVKLLVPAGGPIISMATGILFLLIFKKIYNPFISLLVFWLGINSIIGFLGYMMIAPFASVGDTGKIFHLLEIPYFLQLALAVLFLIVTVLFLVKIYEGFEFFITEDIPINGKKQRVRWAQSLIMIPIFSGIVITTLLQFPIPHVLSILPTLMLPFMLFMTYGKLVTSKDALPLNSIKNINDLSYWLILITLFALILNRMLVYGLNF